jgi:hypothetical protein
LGDGEGIYGRGSFPLPFHHSPFDLYSIRVYKKERVRIGLKSDGINR